MATGEVEHNSAKAANRKIAAISPELSEILHMLSSLENQFAAKANAQ
jgi:hypothetical protein